MDNLANVCFKDVNWIQTFGLNENNALDYFALSPFYDRTCNNEVLKMQTKFNDLQELNNRLSAMVGAEYALIYASAPAVFVIAKRNRTSPENAFVIATFFIYEGNIYASPTLNTIVSNRILTEHFKVYHELVRKRMDAKQTSDSQELNFPLDFLYQNQ